MFGITSICLLNLISRLIARIRQSHTDLEGATELPLSDLVKHELQTDPDGFSKILRQSLTLETTGTAFPEFPSLYSQELFHLVFLTPEDENSEREKEEIEKEEVEPEGKDSRMTRAERFPKVKNI